MSSGLYTHTTRAVGLTLTANIYNTDHTNHISNHIPTMMDDYSTDISQMRETLDPYASEADVQPAALSEELKALRYQVLDIHKALGMDTTYWNRDVNYVLKKNALMNADFNVQQRGTNFNSAANGTYTMDRWLYSKVGAMVHDVDLSSDVPTVAESGHKSRYSINVDCTTVDSSIAAGDFALLSQKIEGFNYLPLAQQAMTLSFWHKHTKAGTYCVAFRNSGPDRSYVAEYTQAVADTWEKATINITASPSAGTWDYTTGVGLEVIWTLACGTTFHGTVDTWESANDLATSNQVNACDNTANNFRLSQVKLEQGSVATRFVGEEIGADLIKCKRYYEELNNAGNTVFFCGVGQNISTTATRVYIQYEVEKATLPTVTMSAAADFDVTQAAGTAEAVTSLSFSFVSVSRSMANVAVAANLVAGEATMLTDTGTGSSRIYIDAEL